MLDFANKYYLLFLLAIPVIWLLFMLSRRATRNKIKRFGNPAVLAHLMPEISRYKHGVKLVLCLIALAAIIIALARPRYGEKEEVATSEGAEIVIAFDVSQSMLAPSTDDPESESRLQRAQRLLEKLVQSLDKDKIGLVAFAGEARMEMPLTSDRHIIEMSLDNDLQPGMMSHQGTSISKAIETSVFTFPELRKRLRDPDYKEKDKSQEVMVHRAIILLTDAEDHEGEALEAARFAARQGIQIDVIGVGSELGGRIPDQQRKGEYLHDFDGNEVITKLNTEAASQIAAAGGGVYVNAASSTALETLQNSLNRLKKTEFEQVTYKMSAEQFPLFAWIALAFLILELFILESKTRWLKGDSIFGHKLGTAAKQSKKEEKNKK